MNEIKTPKQLLDEALCAIQQWINDGFPKTEHDFTCSAGLCGAVYRYMILRGHSIAMVNLVGDMLSEEFGWKTYPFNRNGLIGYTSEIRNRNVYRNKARRQWLKERTQCLLSQ